MGALRAIPSLYKKATKSSNKINEVDGQWHHVCRCFQIRNFDLCCCNLLAFNAESSEQGIGRVYGIRGGG